MIEKIKADRYKKYYLSGYIKPKGKFTKRQIHKKLRKMDGFYRKGIMNRIGLSWEWS